MNPELRDGVRELIDNWNHASPPGQRIANPPATEADLAAVERTLGFDLPNSYTAFLRISNGWEMFGAPAWGLRGLRRVNRIGPFRTLESEWYEAWREALEEAPEDDPAFQLFDRCLVLSKPGEAAILLDPRRRDDRTAELACYIVDNDTPGVAYGPRSFAAVLDHVISQLGSAKNDDSTLRQRALNGENAWDDIAKRGATSWRARSMDVQYRLFTNKVGLIATNQGPALWNGHLEPPIDLRSVADPVVVHDILPLYVVENIQEPSSVEYFNAKSPQLVRDRIRTLRRDFFAGTLEADFTYAPEFNVHVEEARRLIVAGTGDPWGCILGALGSWTPRSDHHVLPLGLRFDRRLRPLLIDATRHGDRPYRAIEVTEMARNRL